MSAWPAVWNRFADHHAARPIRKVAGYEATVSDAAARLRHWRHGHPAGGGCFALVLQLHMVARFPVSDGSLDLVLSSPTRPVEDECGREDGRGNLGGCGMVLLARVPPPGDA